MRNHLDEGGPASCQREGGCGTESRPGNYLNSIRGCLLSTGSAHVILEQSRVFDRSTIKAYVQPNQEDHWSDIEVLLQEVGVEMFVAAVPDISAME